MTCLRCKIAPVACSFSLNGLELIYCDSCVDAVVRATLNVYDQNRRDESDLAVLDEAERGLQDLVDRGQWKA